MSGTQEVRYSQGTKDIGEARNFPWEYPVPDNKFWSDLPFATARTFLESFSAEDAAKLPIDSNSTLEPRQKLELLLTLLQSQLDKKEADSKPQSLFDADYNAWERIHTGVFCVQKDLGDNVQAEATLHMLIERRKDKTNLSLPFTLCGMLLGRGEYEEVAKKLPDIIEWLDGHLGKNSPQALGGRRMLAETLWRLDRKAEAEALFTEIKEMAESMADGPYAPYRDVEVEAAQKLSQKLKETET